MRYIGGGAPLLAMVCGRGPLYSWARKRLARFLVSSALYSELWAHLGERRGVRRGQVRSGGSRSGQVGRGQVRGVQVRSAQVSRNPGGR